MTNRPEWDIYFLLMAQVAASRSTCLRRKVGAVLVRDRQILSTGYNGAPRGVSHCEKTGCLRERLGIASGERHEICRGSHAEINAIAQAAAAGTATAGSWLYCTHEPCIYCTKALINAGCEKVFSLHPYPDELARAVMAESGVESIWVDPQELPRETEKGAIQMSISIVLADDHPLTREGIKGYLSKEPDFNIVGEYADGNATWAGIQTHRPQVALLDIRMPGLDGIAIARKVKEAGIPTASLMLTSYDANQYVMAALRAGARGYVLKTATMDTLSRAIRIAARGGFYLDSDVASAVEEGEDFVPEPVSVREREVLLLAARGLSGKEIASQLFISERTVQTHLASIYDKLGAKNKTEAMLLSLKYGIVTMEELLD
jgi:DNA-binding NarL/FixJ family response regulator/deoxycytidylate deaminase